MDIDIHMNRNFILCLCVALASQINDVRVRSQDFTSPSMPFGLNFQGTL